jgi:hypothetical protein
MSEKTEIKIDIWNDAIVGNSNNPVGDNIIKQLSLGGKLVVVGREGERFDPVLSDDGTWSLRPEAT